MTAWEKLRETCGWLLFFALWVAAIALPCVLLVAAGLVPAVVAGIALPLGWVAYMPSTCTSGGLAATLAMWQVMAGFGWLVIGVVRLVRFLWAWWVG
jgi:hypothetical protein